MEGCEGQFRQSTSISVLLQVPTAVGLMRWMDTEGCDGWEQMLEDVVLPMILMGFKKELEEVKGIISSSVRTLEEF